MPETCGQEGTVPEITNLLYGMSSFDSYTDEQIRYFHGIMLWLNQIMEIYGLSEMKFLPNKYRAGSLQKEDYYIPVSAIKTPRPGLYFWEETINPRVARGKHFLSYDPK